MISFKSQKIKAVALDSNRTEDNTNKDVVIEFTDTSESKPVDSDNPYDIPDDF